MACEDAAARVAEIRARHAEYPPPEWSEVAILLAALAAAEAERDRQAELRAEWQTMAEEFRAIAATRSTERDQARADAADAMLAHGLAVESLRHVGAECKRDMAAAEQRATRLEARLAAQQPVLDAVLKLSTYSRETVDAGVQRIVETLGDYEDWLLEHPDEQ